MLMAGIDGVQKDLDPGEPADFDLFEEHRTDIAQVPGSLAEALDALERDHEFLLAGGVFTEDADQGVDRLQAGAGGGRRRASGRTRPSSRSTTTPRRVRRKLS